jgi:O-methyltransferase
MLNVSGDPGTHATSSGDSSGADPHWVDHRVPDKHDGMPDEAFQKLLSDVREQFARGVDIAIVGATSTAARLLHALNERESQRVVAVFDATNTSSLALGHVLPLSRLSDVHFGALVIASDDEKEQLVLDALPYLKGTPQVILAGYRQYDFVDPILDEEIRNVQVPSLANGYPHVVTHMYQCLRNAKRLGLDGEIAELGMFRGGTTMLLSRLVERLGATWRIIGFDTFAGFPPRRTALDMYAHPDCEWTDLDSVRSYLRDRNVEIVVGDIVETCVRLKKEPLLLTFFDTDNYSPARAALDIVREQTVVGGAIVFDHFTGVDRFRYTLGERMAAKVLLDDCRYFHLHGTGVFYRQR